MNFRSQVLSGLRWVAGTRILSQLFTWVITIVVVRILSPADYGLLAMATVFVEFLGMMAQFGVGAALVQTAEIDERKLRQMFGFAILSDVALFLILFLAAPLIALFFEEQRLVPIVRVIAFQFLIMIFAVIPSSQLSRGLHFKAQSVVEITGAIVGSLTTLWLALAGFGVWALVWGNLAMAIWRTVGVNIVWPYFRWPEFSFEGTRRLLFFGGNFTVTQILWSVYSQSDVLIAGKLLGGELLGVYSVAMRLAGLPVNKISAIVNYVSFPAFATIQHDQEKFATHFLMAVRVMSFAAFPVLWGISSIAPEAVAVLLGEKWIPVIQPLQLIAVIMPVHMFAPFMNTAAMGIGRADIPVKQVLLAALVMPIAFVVGSRWGVVGLAVAWVAVFPFVFIGAMKLFLPVIGLRIRDMLGAMALPVLASLGMYVMVAVARTILGPATNDVARMTALMLVGMVAYGVLTLVVNRGGYREIISTLRG